jgi:cell division protein FtsB
MSRRGDDRRDRGDLLPGRRRGASGAHAAPRRTGLGRAARRLVAPAILTVVTIGVLVLGAFPTKTLLDQRRTAASSEAQLEQLQASNAAAQAQVDALRTDAKVEELARTDYGYAKPGEEVYHVLPPARDPVRVPEAWPFTALGGSLER